MRYTCDRCEQRTQGPPAFTGEFDEEEVGTRTPELEDEAIPEAIDLCSDCARETLIFFEEGIL